MKISEIIQINEEVNLKSSKSHKLGVQRAKELKSQKLTYDQAKRRLHDEFIGDPKNSNDRPAYSSGLAELTRLYPKSVRESEHMDRDPRTGINNLANRFKQQGEQYARELFDQGLDIKSAEKKLAHSDLNRSAYSAGLDLLWKLYGDDELNESASCGATGAGSVASVASPMGATLSREPNLFGYASPVVKKRKKKTSN